MGRRLVGCQVLRSRTAAVAVAAAAVVITAPLSACSVFQRSASQSAAEMPETSGPPVASASGVSPSVAAAGRPSAPAPIAVPANAPVPPTVPGYTLSPASATVMRTFQGVTGKFNGMFAGLTVRTVTKGPSVTATVVLLGLHPELVGNSTVERGLLPGMTKGMAGQGAKTSMQKVGGQDVAMAATKTTNILAWYKGGTVVLVLGGGADPAPTLAFAKAYLAAR